MTYTARDIAKYIISYCFARNTPISNLKLQKMLYYVWIDYYKRRQVELFLDDICAWQLGPVVPEIYYEFCSYAGRPIMRKYDTQIDQSDVQLIDSIIDSYRPLSARELVDRSHEKGKPWDLIYRNGLGNRDVIPFSLIKAKECS